MRFLLAMDLIPDRQQIIQLLLAVNLAAEVFPVDNGAALEAELKRKVFDLALVAERFAGNSGLEVFRWIRTAQPELPVLILGDRVDEPRASQGLQAGVDDYLFRPQWGRLVQVVPRILELARLRRVYGNQADRLNWLEERYQIVSELLSDYIYDFQVAPDGSVTPDWVSAAFARITGFTLEDLEQNRDLYWFVHPDDVTLAQKHIYNLVVLKHPDEVELRVRNREGGFYWLHVSARPVWDSEEQQVVRVVGAVRNITERRQAEEALRQSEKRYRAVSELTSDYAYSLQVSLTGEIVREWLAGNFRRIMGYEPEELDVKSNWLSLVYPADLPMVRAHWNRLMAGEADTIEFRVVTRAGEIRWIHLFNHPVWNSQQARVVQVYGGMRDITDRKLAEAALRRAHDELEMRVVERTAELARANTELQGEIEERRRAQEELAQARDRAERLHGEAQRRAYELDAIFKALTDAVMVYDAQGVLLRANPAAEALLGFDPIQVDGITLIQRTGLRFCRGGQLLTVEALSVTRALHGEIVEDELRCFNGKGGVPVIILASAAPLFEGDQVVGAVVIWHDVTEREQSREFGEALNRVNAAINLTFDVGQIVQSVMAEAVRALEAESAIFSVVERSRWVVRHVYGQAALAVGQVVPAEAGGLYFRVIQSGTVELFDSPSHSGICAHLVVPFLRKGEQIGVMDLACRAGTVLLADGALDFARKLAASASLALENAYLYEAARRDAETKSVLLREVNHRVKNNLAALIGLLYAQQRRAGIREQPAYQSVLRDLINWMQGLLTVHSMLSASHWTPLRLDELAVRVIESSLQMLPHQCEMKVTVQPSDVRVVPDQAHSLALVLNELATNAVKHAQQGRAVAHIGVKIQVEGGGVWLEFRDDGPGYPEEVLQGKWERVGLDLILNIVRRNLRGQLTLQNDRGAVAVLRFALVPEPDRGLWAGSGEEGEA